MEFEVVELVDDLLTGLAHEEFGVLDNWSIYLLEGEAPADLPKVAKEPLPKALIFGVKVPRSARRLQVLLVHGR